VQQQEQRPDEIFRDKLWDEYRQRRREKTCSRCGSYKRYWVAPDTPKVIARIEFPAPDKPIVYYQNMYKIDSDTVTNTGTLADNFWYDLCKRCQDHVLGREDYKLDNNRLQAERQKTYKIEAEENRLLYLEDEIKETRARAARIKKGLEEPQPEPTKRQNSI